jgi:hypothetical protein
VTADDIVRRNRANAAKSTGPRTPVGKAIAAQNARRHGATAKLDPERVRLWLKVILAAPDLEPKAADASVDEERRVLALALAEAEARYVLAAQALRDFVAGELARPGVIQVVAGDPGMMRDRASAGGSGTEDRSRKRDPGGRGARALDEDLHPGSRHHRLLRRYLDEAQRRRAKAFSAWLQRG